MIQYKKTRIIALCGPSGVGKTTILERVLEARDDFILSRAATTRRQREGDKNSCKYDFIDEETFHSMARRNQFLEYGERYGNFYGELRAPVDEAVRQNKSIIADIVLIGARNMSLATGLPLHTIGLLPPSIEALEERLVARDGNNDRKRMDRMREFPEFKRMAEECDFVLVNNTLEKTLQDVNNIINATSLHRK